MSTTHNETIQNIAEQLKEELHPPMWADFVKTGHGKERPPRQDDWWYIRGAAILTSVEELGPIGTNKLSRKYGTKKNRGYKTEKFTPASRNIIRKLLQQLEEAGYVEHRTVGNHKGRVVTSEGKTLIREAGQAINA